MLSSIIIDENIIGNTDKETDPINIITATFTAEVILAGWNRFTLNANKLASSKSRDNPTKVRSNSILTI